MSASFWQKAQGIQPQIPSAPAYQPPGYPQAPQYQQPQHAPQQAAPQGYQAPEGLAVGAYGRSTDQAGQIAAQQGYIKKPPQWVTEQPTDRCPQCGGVDFAIHGESQGYMTGAYGRRNLIDKAPKNHAPWNYGHCFTCGFTLNGRVQSDSQLGNALDHTVHSGAAQATRQAHGMRNFFQIPTG